MLHGVWCCGFDYFACLLDFLRSFVPSFLLIYLTNTTQAVSRGCKFESDHPVHQGVTEITVSIAGAKEMLLDFDAKSFANMAQGVSVTLYKKPGQQVWI